MSLREPDGSVERALKGRTIVEVRDTKEKIDLVLDDSTVVTLSQKMLPGADGGMYPEAVLSVNGTIFACR